MHKKYRLKKRKDFKKVFRLGRSTANREFVVYRFRRAEKGSLRLGLSVSKRVGNAVMRNRLKRTIKEVVRKWAEDLHYNVDIVLIVRKPAAGMDYYQIESSLRHVLARAKVFRKVPPS